MAEVNTLEYVFPGTSDMAREMREFGWAASPLGPVTSWPQSLRTVLNIMLTTEHPMFLWWGPQLIQFYNDGYRPSFGQDRHEGALGARGREFWQDIWHIIGSQVDGVMQRGEATWQEDALVPIYRNGRMEEVYWTYSYSPVLLDDRSVGGTLVVCQETTSRILIDRRLAMLQELSERLAPEAFSPESVWQAAADVIGENNADFPFSCFYRLDDDGLVLRLAGQCGSLPPEVVPETVRTGLPEPEALPWQLLPAFRRGTAVEYSGLPNKRSPIVSGRWPEPVNSAMVMPISLSPSEKPYGLLVAGISPRLRLDGAYRQFLNLVTSQIATALVTARAIEDIRAAGALKDQFLSLVSHELRTPIATVVGNASLLLRRGDQLKPEDREQALQDVVSEGQRLQRIIENLLLLTRMEADNSSLDQPLSLLSLVQDEIDHLIRRQPFRSVTLQAADSIGNVSGEETLIRMVVENLLSNADKYSPSDQPIDVSLALDDDAMVEVHVRDRGIGVSNTDMGELFTPFFRSDAAKQYARGIGLGLSVCKRIVEAHGGNIWTVSPADGGTEFVFTLPVVLEA